MRKLVAGRWDAVADDVAPLLTRQMQHFQDSILRDGIRKVRGSGALHHDCPPSPAVSAGEDCFVYRLQGSQTVPLQGAVALNSRFRLWVSYEDGRWQVVNYGYDVIPR